PTALLVAALLVLAIGVGALVSSLSARASAGRALRLEQTREEQVVRLASQFNAVDQQRRNTGTDAFAPIPDVLSRIESAARDAGLADRPPIPRQGSERSEDLTKRDYTYTMRDANLDKLLRWVELSTQTVPGMQVSAIELRPEQRTWQVTVTFSRWERQG
ncbi:MAG: hypothetical protein KIS87_06745, partial [Phycisphaeraceae bacterium]|nr:hypothetical protein [Phycisphaeraceae bacterium]